MPRYKGHRIISTAGVTFYDTLQLINPSLADRTMLNTTNHIWAYGDRYYKLAYQMYGRPDYWWVIAWWNARPTEADLSPGDVIVIPINLEDALRALGAY